jgi:hypothetical protein
LIAAFGDSACERRGEEQVERVVFDAGSEDFLDLPDPVADRVLERSSLARSA